MSGPPVAVIGCGDWGRNLVRNFRELGALVAICDTTDAGRRRAAELAPGVAVTGDFGEILGSAIPSVVIATPAETHAAVALQAIEAGKDVFVEKPLALTHREGMRLVSAANERGAILMVGHVLEYHPGIRAMLDLVRGGDLGTVHYIYSNRLSLGKVRREENILWSFAPHDIAVILRLMGSAPVQITAFGGAYIQPGIVDVTVTTLLFDNAVRAHIHVSWLHPFKEQRLVVIGSRKMAAFDDVAKELLLYDQRVELKEGHPVPVRSPGQRVAFSVDEPLAVECRAFLDAVQTRHPPVTDGLSALRVLQVLEAAQLSMSEAGRPVNL